MPPLAHLNHTHALQNSQGNTASASLNTIMSDIPDEKVMKAAKDFEAAFITQMLTYSGLADALTLGGGEAVNAFTSFYIESFAENIVENGGFGLTQSFYSQLIKQNALSDKENNHVDLGRM